MNIVGQGLILAGANLDLITPGLVAVFVGVVLICIVFAWDAYH